MRSTQEAGKPSRLSFQFFRGSTGSEPVRERLKPASRRAEEKREISSDIKTLQFGWLIGMPVVDHIDGDGDGDGDVGEVRTRLSIRIVRVLFTLAAT